MKTACKSCGAAQENRLSADSKKIVCESCNTEISSTSALRALLTKKGLVRSATISMPPSVSLDKRPPAFAAADKRATMSPAEEAEFRRRYKGPTRDNLALQRPESDTAVDVEVRRDMSAPRVQRPNTPGAIARREEAKHREAALRAQSVNLKDGFRQQIETVREAKIADGLAEKNWDIDTANAILDQVLDESE